MTYEVVVVAPDAAPVTVFAEPDDITVIEVPGQGPQGVKGDTGDTGAQGVKGDKGDTGIPGNTVLYGATNPTADVGVDGNFYINTATDFLYGPKAAGAWPAGTSLVGPQGLPGGTFPDAASDGVVYGRKNAAWAAAVATAGDTMSGTLTVTPKGSLFGTAAGTLATGAVASSDANIKLYEISAVNWCGLGCDNNGTFWLRTGLTGTPAPALYVDTSQFLNLSKDPTGPAHAATKQYCDSSFQAKDAQLFAGVPLSGGAVRAGAYTCVATDAQKCVASSAGLQTIPANSVVPFPVGTVIMFVAFGGSITIACGGSDLLYWNGPSGSVSGTRTMTNVGMATAIKMNATNWVINGSGLT